MPDIAGVHIDQALTNFSVAYVNPIFAAEQVLPVLPVDKRSDKYFVYSRSFALSASGLDANNRALSLRRPGREARSIDYQLSTDSYYAEEYALRELVTDAQRAVADNPLQPDFDASMFLKNTLLLDYEQMANNLVGTASNYPSANKATLTTGASGTSWASYGSANSLPMKNIQDGKSAVIKAIQTSPNRFGITHTAAKVLSEHPAYRDEFKYVSSEGLTMSGLLPVLKGLQVVEWLTQSTSGDVWVDTANGLPYALIYYATGDVMPRSVQFGRTFEAPDDLSRVRGLNIRRYRWEPLKGEYLEASMLRDLKFVSVDANSKAIGGFLYSSVVV